jgi:hypothetical protein
MGVYDEEGSTSVLDRSADEAGYDDPMKFDNGGISLEEAIEANGGHLAGLHMTALFDIWEGL